MAQVEPMDIDNIVSDFDDKENSLQNSNVLSRTPCTEKGYEELDVSELNMKLRYSITPASSPMSKSFTANSNDNKTYNLGEDSLNSTIVNNTNLTRSLNSTIKSDISFKCPKLPLQVLPTDQYIDINTSVRRSIDDDPNDITITVNGTDNIDENLSLPSTSSSTVQTPEATTPTKDIPKNDGGSPIMRGLKSVLNMFRSSQSPIPLECTDKKEPIESHLEGQVQSQTLLSSTPKAFKNKDNNTSKRSSPLKDSVVFNDDLERELQWKDETTILFKEEKIPIHKLFLQQSTCVALEKKLPGEINNIHNLNTTCEYMDISYNESGINNKTMTDVESKIGTNNIEVASGVESDGEFLDCETTYTKNEKIDFEQQLKTTLPDVQQVYTTFEVHVERNDLTQEHNEKSVTQINEQRQTDMLYIETVSDNEPIVEANNIQIEDKTNVSSSLNEVQSDANLINEANGQVPNTPVEFKNESQNCQNDEIHTNNDMTALLNMSMTSDLQSNEMVSVKDQPYVLTQHNLINNNETTTTALENTNNVSNIVNCAENEIINLKDENQFDVTKPLNIVTDYQDDIYEDNDSNNVVHIEKEKLEVNKNDTQPLKSGILQICEKILVNNEYSDSNNILNVIDLKSTTYSEEIKNIESDIEHGEIIKSYNENIQENAKNNETDELSTINQNAQEIEADKIELTSMKNNNDILYLDNQPDSLENVINILHLNENNQNNDKEESINKISLSNDLENNNLQNNENNAKLDDLVYNELKNNLPSDIPLPSDDDIEKDSLTDSFVIKYDTVEKKDIEILTPVTKDETKDLIETIDEICGGSVVTNPQHYNNLSNTLPNEDLPNLDQIHENILSDNVSSSLTSNHEVLNNKSEMTQEYAPIDSQDNKSILTDTVHEINHHEFLNNTVNLNQQIINPASVVEHLDLQTINTDNQKVENEVLEKQNSNIVDEESNSNILNDVLKLKENKEFDEEIVTSANNSPYVSVNDVDLDIHKNDIKLDDTENPFEKRNKVVTSPPISPKLTRKGYNIDFDLIEDPFATKTNIRMSPPPETSPKNSSASVDENIKKTNVQKRVQQQNRRKSQPERQKRDITKKRFNSSYSCETKYSNCKEQKDKVLNQNISDKNEEQEENNRIDLNCTVETPVLEDNDLKCEKEVHEKHEIDNLNISEKKLLNPEKTVKIDKEDISFDAPNQDKSFKQNITSDNTSIDSFQPRNVFNLPEIDDMNFNPFVSKSKIRNSPSPTHEKKNFIKESKTSSDLSIEVTQKPQVENLNIEKDIQENKVVSPDKSSETCSSKNTDRDFTMQEIHTEDEDTIEGPFLEAEEFADVVKVSDFGTEADMMQFEDLPVDMNHENKEDGELFIDAEAFEFLLNQNKSNVVADSGKESLFLKFDPLFAKRISSDGMLAALSRIQKRQSTPKKTPETFSEKNVIDEEKPSVSSLNAHSVYEESIDEANITVTKPMMVVNPAINSLVSPRKSTTPPRINRRSLTFTSPAMAVIDRLLSLSGNGSMLEHETTLPRTNREYNETDVALTQLRELLAEKEIHVHNLRSESKELKERLATMESQVKTLEKESEERLKKVNDLNEHLAEKSKINKSMAIVVEEYERTIASLIAEMEQEKRRNAEERRKLIGERDEQTAHLASMEVSFSDLHSKYEKSKQIILSMKANEDTYRKSMKEFEDNLLKMQNNYELLKQHATSKLNHANQELEKFNRAHESEVLKLNAMIKRKELHITSLEESLAQKTKANEELTAICDELINKVG